MNLDAIDIFRRVYKGNNIMTPNVMRIDFSTSSDYICELSSGRGFEADTTIYGVTVITKNGEETDLSKCFHSKYDAEVYIESL